jgi:hypothetical protein
MSNKPRSEGGFILNEPQPKIKNGSTRKSVKVSAKQFPARAQREKINRLLIMHDLHTDVTERFTGKDIDLLKQIALEGSISNNIPAFRYNAIQKLAAFPTAAILNTLHHLANFGEDHFVRSKALLALGVSGIELSIPVIARSIDSDNILISNAAQKALIRLINNLGVERVRQYFKSDSSLNYQVLERMMEPKPARSLQLTSVS